MSRTPETDLTHPLPSIHMLPERGTSPVRDIVELILGVGVGTGTSPNMWENTKPLLGAPSSNSLFTGVSVTYDVTSELRLVLHDCCDLVVQLFYGSYGPYRTDCERAVRR